MTTTIPDRLLKALETARRYVEPHPSWESEQRQREALEAIHAAIGPSAEYMGHCPRKGHEQTS